MEFRHLCRNCEYNSYGKCIGNSKIYGQMINDDTQSCVSWQPDMEYHSQECIVAPRFLREKYLDYSLSYSDFSDQFRDYRNGIDIPINIFDAIKYIYGLSMIDIAVLADVTYNVVFQAKTKHIPLKRIQQFCNALHISQNTLLGNSTAIFDELRKGKALLFDQESIVERLSFIPDWKKKIVYYISNTILCCPMHLAKTFARIDNMQWSSGVDISEYTESERALIAFFTKMDKNIVSIEYCLGMTGMPIIKTRTKR